MVFPFLAVTFAGLLTVEMVEHLHQEHHVSKRVPIQTYKKGIERELINLHLSNPNKDDIELAASLAAFHLRKDPYYYDVVA